MTISSARSVVANLNEADFAKEVEQSPLPVFLDFHAAWCGPCEALAPLFDTLAETYVGQVRFLKVDINENRELAQRLSIRGVPSLLLLQNGQVLERIAGARHKAYLVDLLNKYVQHPVAAASAPVRSFRAFHDDASLHKAVVAGVRRRIDQGRIVPRKIADAGASRRHFSLMGATLGTADTHRCEQTLSIPTSVSHLQETVHELLIEQTGGLDDPQYLLRPPYRMRPLEWWEAIPPGADLQLLPGYFIHWFLQDLIASSDSRGTQLSKETRSVLESVAKLHFRAAQGNMPGGKEWADERINLAALLNRSRSENEEKPFSPALIMLEIAERLAWPVHELDNALADAIRLRRNIEIIASSYDDYTPEQLAEISASRDKLEKAINKNFPARESVTREQLEALDEYKEASIVASRYRPLEEAQQQKVILVYGERLHSGLMQALQATISTTS